MRYGWIRDTPDPLRDLTYSASRKKPLPSKINLVQEQALIYSQGDLGSCTANAIAAALEFDQMKQNLPEPFLPSRLFIYFNEREMEGTIASDAGAQIRDGIKSVVQTGVCDEQLYPYLPEKFAERPPERCYEEAIKHPALTYKRVTRTLPEMRGCLAEDYPFCFGIPIYSSFESQEVADTGMVPMPQPGEDLLGGHAVLCVGFDDTTRLFTVRNSWGDTWAKAGYFFLPYEYMLSYASDLWVIRTVQ